VNRRTSKSTAATSLPMAPGWRQPAAVGIIDLHMDC
jgi:hypothetical protein